MSRPPAIARQLDRCDVCGKKIHRKDLVRTQMRYVKFEGTNYLLYSSYNSSFWSCDASDVSTIGMGPHGDESRVQIALDNTVSQISGSQSWSGTGTFRSTTATDLSSLTTFTFSCELGPLYSYSSNVGSIAELTVAMGICDEDGNNKDLQRTWSGLRSQTKCWYNMDVADIASPLSSSTVYFYITVTVSGTNYWFVDDLTVEGGKTAPTTFLKAAGAAISNSADAKSMAVVKACKNCREPLLRESEQFGRPHEEYEAPISSDPQEV